MANQLNLTATVLNNTVNIPVQLQVTEVVNLEFSIDAAEVDMEVALTGIASPKIILINGARGISAKLAALGTVIPCDPVAVITSIDTPGAQATILLSNSDSQAHTVTILAAE